VWAAYLDEVAPYEVSGELFRVVESQEEIATTHLVENDLEAQAILEEMLDENKPDILQEWKAAYHYLLYTPFRYPPLQYGSRFGTLVEPSLFYGSLSSLTAFTEVAYYRLLFWYDMDEHPATPMLTQHTLFTVPYSSEAGYRLQDPPFNNEIKLITHPADYSPTQQLGSLMREHEVELFEYPSARHKGGINVALFTPNAFALLEPDSSHEVICTTDSDHVTIKDQGEVYRFDLKLFLVEGKLPAPA